MSTSLLYHALGLRDYHETKISFSEGAITFHICHVTSKLRCPACGGSDIRCRGTKLRTFKSVPFGAKRVFLELTAQRVECKSPLCGVVQQAHLRFADPLRTYTRSFERYARQLLLHMTVKDVAAHLGVSWDTIKDIQKRYLQANFGRPKLGHLKRIAIDEICIGAGHRYLTVVLDLDNTQVVFVGDGKGVDTLAPFWKRLHASRARVKAVAVDMSPAFTQAITQNLPGAILVYDHFHIAKLMNEKLSDFRRELHRQTEDRLQRKVLKGTRWLLLKNAENLDKRRRNERARLDEALALNQPLATAYYMKEELRLLWCQESRREADAFLKDWMARARASDIKMLIQFADTLERHRSGILAWYRHPISTGPLEGTNNKIKLMQRKSYGLRDREFFKLKILALHESRQVLVGA